MRRTTTKSFYWVRTLAQERAPSTFAPLSGNEGGGQIADNLILEMLTGVLVKVRSIERK